MIKHSVIVIGGGHAGIEAACASANLNVDTLLITLSLNNIGKMPCNPSIGGPAKGIVVREIDALGGIQGYLADECTLQIKLLNNSKGSAVHALRAQIDKEEYKRAALRILKQTKNLSILEGQVKNIIFDEEKVTGVILSNGEIIYCEALILTTGTYLNSDILIGDNKEYMASDGEITTNSISQDLIKMGFRLLRFKTGTPPRIAKDSIDYSKLSIQFGDKEDLKFSYFKNSKNFKKNIPCYLLHTNKTTKEIILNNLKLSSMYGGYVEGTGPRYCPSIEDKIVRFIDKEIHQLFIEPESEELDTMYLQGFSTSMPKEIQEKLVHSLYGLENASIVKYAYAIEYDAIDPLELFPSLETKKMKKFYTAGQINGTSGYEEAAGQGLIAGINAALKVKGEKEFILSRSESYIGVMIDDLVTKGTNEPYRLFSSRAEHRLLLRNDNADFRLSKYGHELGLISDKYYIEVLARKERIEKIKEIANTTKTTFKDLEKNSISNLLKRPEISILMFSTFFENYSYEDLLNAEIEIKYQGYIEKEINEIEKLKKLDNLLLDINFDYSKIKTLSNEAKEKFNKIKPYSLIQAKNIPGINPSDIVSLLIYLNSNKI
ncbi:MAG: tRNA uridine-5-carboxymethylaminomethyl(34) synthesis enzyme MnmG [Acholeplasmatales bacterium]|jgi:tRNA uridine 5-carboxymethylaminomethyl modification enzyme|nr:tRNA uridine-5-carboxymethylaminomethyl(34) synthesis enzyme MnmG [Acholeplasmatales bacterium]